MNTKSDNPGVYVPPPLFYVILFLISVFLQRSIPLPNGFFKTSGCSACGAIFVAIALVILLPALFRFYQTKNSLITILPARSLETSGIYAVTRNPMYLGLLILYTGIAFFKGNLWTFFLIPVVVLVVTCLVIYKEENYLDRAFGEEYTAYKSRVRRWL